MKFWDASALVPLIIRDAATDLVRPWLEEDADMIVWSLTRLELVATVESYTRQGQLTARQRTIALARVERLAREAHEVSDISAVRTRALPLLARHALGPADAAQLAAALLVADPDPSSLTMAVLDRPLAEAAEREGLHVLTWADAASGSEPPPAPSSES